MFVVMWEVSPGVLDIYENEHGNQVLTSQEEADEAKRGVEDSGFMDVHIVKVPVPVTTWNAQR